MSFKGITSFHYVKEDENYPTLENYDRDEFRIEGTTLEEYLGDNSYHITINLSNETEPSFSYDIQIPLGVTEISPEVFKDFDCISSVYIPSSVKKIGESAFEYCGLHFVIIPNSVEIIDNYAFGDCRWIEEVTIPAKLVQNDEDKERIFGDNYESIKFNIVGKEKTTETKTVEKKAKSIPLKFDKAEVSDVVQAIKDHCMIMDILEQVFRKDYEEEKQSVAQQSEALKNQLKQQYEKYKNKYFVGLKQKIESLMELLCEDYGAEWTNIKDKAPTFSGMDFKSLEGRLHAILENLNKNIQELNATDFDKLVPPVTVEIQNEEFITYTVDKTNAKRFDCKTQQMKSIEDPKPLKEIAKKTLLSCKEAMACLDALAAEHERQFNISAFNSFVQNNEREWLAELAAKLRSGYDKRFDELFRDEKAEAIPDSFFVKLEQDGRTFDVDMSTGTDSYNEAINIGNIKYLVESQEKHLSYIKKSPVLKKHMQDGYLSAPLIHNLKNHGSIFFNIDEVDYSEATKKFINQIIIQFLLSFPASRINFCLIDPDERMEFSKYKKLVNINPRLLFNGIIRDSSEILDTITDLRKVMLAVDETREQNGATDIYDYNERYKANPQNIHLLVFVNYPTGMREETATKLKRIIEKGKENGVFTLIINNKSSQAKLDYGFERKDADKLIKELTKHALVINKDGQNFYLPDLPSNKFVPKKEDYFEHLPAIVDVLKDKAEYLIQNAMKIDLLEMFQETDRVAASPKGIPSYAEVLEIPIGKRGGEIQTIELKTTGAGAVHSVVIGGTGSGKSNLLHTIIMNACYRYSPEELNLWLVDFKGGVEFKYYEANKDKSKQLPHVKLTSLTSELEDGVAVLNNLHIVLRNREDEFRRNRVEDIVQYRNLGKTMPRLLVIIDEIQELFERDSNLGEKAVNILSEIFKKGRAFGINILWASQNIPRTGLSLDDKILSQIGNRISLRLNNPSDAEQINIDPKAVKALNRPEKGLGVINDIRYGNESVEFRVAYAETSEKRLAYSQRIINKWSDVVANSVQEPLFIVGDDDDPSPIDGSTLYNEDIAKATTDYQNFVLQLGQDYITGKPFDIALPTYRENMNVVLFGYDIEMLRDMMGYSLLSLIRNNLLNKSQFVGEPHIYCANGERITDENSKDLFNVIKNDYGDLVENIFLHETFTSCITRLYQLYLNRREESKRSEKQIYYAPQFVVIHSIQKYKDLLEENPMLSLLESDTTSKEVATKEKIETPIAHSGINSQLTVALNAFPGDSETFDLSEGIANHDESKIIRFSDAFQSLLINGGAYGIHFIISVDNPNGMPGIREQLGESMYKVFIKGVDINVMQQMINDFRITNVLNNPKVALIVYQNERSKIRVYRYDDKQDSNWYRVLCNRYNAFRRKK